MMDDKRRKFEANNFYNLGVSFIHREFIDRAEYAFQKSVELDSENAMAWAYLSKLFERDGRMKEANEAYQRAIKLDKDIDFEAIQKDCRLFEDRISITKVVNQYQASEMTTDEFIDFISRLSKRGLALISNHPRSKSFFESAIAKSINEKIVALEFEYIPNFFGHLKLPLDAIVPVLDRTILLGIISKEKTNSLLALLKFIGKQSPENQASRIAKNRIQEYGLLSKTIMEELTDSDIIFERAVSFLKILETNCGAKLSNELLSHLTNLTSLIIIQESAKMGTKGVHHIFSVFEKDEQTVVNTLGVNMIKIIVFGNKRDIILDFFKLVQEELTMKKSSKIVVNQAQEWYDVLSLIDNKLKKSSTDYEQIINLLDVIEETNGKFEPIIIAEQCLRLISIDLHSDNTGNNAQELFGQISEEYVIIKHKFATPFLVSKKVRKWLDAIKRSYYKLHSIADDDSLKLDKNTQFRLQEIADEMLDFLVKSRTNDLVDLTADDDYMKYQLMEIFFPNEYLSFPVPAFRALTRLFKNPYPLAATIEMRRPNIRVLIGKWQLAGTLSLVALARHLFVDKEYFPFMIYEYIKVLSLGMNCSVEEIEGLKEILEPFKDNFFTAESILIHTIKGLAENKETNLSRAEIEEALEYGGWDLSLSQIILSDKTYCVKCKFEADGNPKTCPNCGWHLKILDLSKLTFRDIDPGPPSGMYI